jgi:hypothetical protein
MNESQELPTAEERRQFARQLGQLRAALPASRHGMLIAAILAAFAPGTERDVQGYEWFSGHGEPLPSDPNVTPNPNVVPKWYEGGDAAAGDDTAWAAVYHAVPQHAQ